MSKESRWIRLNADWSKSEWLFVLTPGARLAWIELLCYCKLYGNGRGSCPAKSPLVFAGMTYVAKEDVESMIVAAVNAGALSAEGGAWTVTAWNEYQTPQAEAMRKARNVINSESHLVTTSNACHATVTETVTKKEKPPKSPKGDLVDFEGAECPESLREAAVRWQAYKRAKRQSWIRETWETNFRKFSTDPSKFTRMVDFTIERGYQGLLDPAEKNGKPGMKSQYEGIMQELEARNG